jgi:hypothetical protein
VIRGWLGLLPSGSWGTWRCKAPITSVVWMGFEGGQLFPTAAGEKSLYWKIGYSISNHMDVGSGTGSIVWVAYKILNAKVSKDLECCCGLPCGWIHRFYSIPLFSLVSYLQ